jgi:hypothetical protein
VDALMNTAKDQIKPEKSSMPEHFKGKDALEHVIEAQAEGIMASSEVHGTELPGSLSAACDAARESVLVLVLVAIIGLYLNLPVKVLLLIFFTLMVGWTFWKGGRSAWLGWFRLERLHRVLEQERWEIEHHRQQERDELRELYAAKGFEGKLLEDVLDVLMADNERLLRVMIEEELGLSLQAYEHPLKQGVGAALGAALAAAVCLLLFWLWSLPGLLAGAVLVVGGVSAVSAARVQNNIVSAIVWNIGLGILAAGCVYYLLEFINSFLGGS